MFVGNDVVDITTPYSLNKANDRRFIERVFNGLEREYIDGSENPTFTLWCLWAAKEAAFKVAFKHLPGLAFSHPEFGVVLKERSLSQSHFFGVVEYEKQYFHVRWDVGERYIHCLAVDSDAKSMLNDERCIRISSPMEDAHRYVHKDISTMVFAIDEAGPSVQHGIDESLRVRQLALRLLSHVCDGEVEIVRERCAGGLCPPAVYVEGHRVNDLDISLSHDGNFVAAAVVFF